MKKSDSLAKIFGKAIVLAFVAVVFVNLAEVYLRPLLPEMSDRRFTKDAVSILVIVVFFGILLYFRLFGRRGAKPKVDPTQIVKVRVEVGGMVKLKNPVPSVDHNDLVERWLVKNIKMDQLPELLQKGEFQFSEGGNDYDFLLDFIELEDGSGKVLQTLMVIKGDSKQLEFIQKLSRCKLEWRCDHVNGG